MNKYVLSLLVIFFTSYGYCHANSNTEKMVETELASFQQTKNPQHLKTVLEYLKNQSDDVVFLAYEWKNREFLEDMAKGMGMKPSGGLKEIQQVIKNHKDYDKIVLARLIMESLQCMENPSINKMGKDLIARDPSLDYWKRIFKLMGRPYKGFTNF